MPAAGAHDGNDRNRPQLQAADRVDVRLVLQQIEAERVEPKHCLRARGGQDEETQETMR
jgi:hypothetical protein